MKHSAILAAALSLAVLCLPAVRLRLRPLLVPGLALCLARLQFGELLPQFRRNCLSALTMAAAQRPARRPPSHRILNK